MNKWRNLLSWLLFVAVYSVAYFYLHESGFWVRYRWTGLVFGATLALMSILFDKGNGLGAWPRRVAMVVFLGGLGILLIFLFQHGSSADGFIGSVLVGLAAPALYAHYKAWRFEMQSRIPPS